MSAFPSTISSIVLSVHPTQSNGEILPEMYAFTEFEDLVYHSNNNQLLSGSRVTKLSCEDYDSPYYDTFWRATSFRAMTYRYYMESYRKRVQKSCFKKEMKE
ncbi:hypothetical protein LINGRAHAP2_LOCUS23940 [Linum grandiflorum]